MKGELLGIEERGGGGLTMRAGPDEDEEEKAGACLPSISHVHQWALSLSGSLSLGAALHPLPTQLHPVIKEPMGTRKLIVLPQEFRPSCCRAELLTPVPLPGRPPFFLQLPSRGKASG